MPDPSIPSPLSGALRDLPSGDLLVGYSGGLDSSVLLHWLATAGPSAGRLRAIHVHHGLSERADDWAVHCQHVCDAIGLPLLIERVGPIDGRASGIEAAARHARRAAFRRHLHPDECLVLAQHQEDQAETLLIRLLRHSGSSGLAGMRRWSRIEHSGHAIWRPLLDTPRAQIRAYAQNHGLRWVEDPSNDSPDHLRNRLRHLVLPALLQADPQAIEAIASSCRILATEVDIIDGVARKALARLQSLDAQVLQLQAWPSLAPGLGAAVIRLWMDSLGLPRPNGRALTRLLDQLHRPTTEPWTIEWPGARLTRYRDLLHTEPPPSSLPKTDDLAWDGQSALIWPPGGSLHLEGAPAEPCDWRVCGRKGGERILLPGRHQHTPLKNVLQTFGVPPWERARMPLIVNHAGELLAAGDLILSASMQASLNASGRQLRWRTGV